METAPHGVGGRMNIGRRDTQSSDFLLWVMQRPNCQVVEAAPQAGHASSAGNAVLEQCLFREIRVQHK